MSSLTLGVGASLLQEIQSLLINWKGPDLTIYGELVLEGTFRVHRVRSEKTFFLFDKALLITKKRGDHFVYKGHIPVTRPQPPLLALLIQPRGGVDAAPSFCGSSAHCPFPHCAGRPSPSVTVLLTDADRKHPRLPVLHRHPLQAQQTAVQHPGESGLGHSGWGRPAPLLA